MPCNDVSDIIYVVLDGHERLVSYCLTKKTCGRGISDSSLLLSKLKGLDILSLVELDFYNFAKKFALSDIEEFLVLKHLTSLQKAILSYLGKENSDTACEVLSLAMLTDRTEFTVSVSSNILTSNIRPCSGGRCGGCQGGCRS
ncbi:hypothetical protein HZA41_03220 [Candidatus Peregrinibacteria bacterium]|nr:hypothetical protein [Candidatus Peregrinibacteria bacterium]